MSDGAKPLTFRRKASLAALLVGLLYVSATSVKIWWLSGPPAAMFMCAHGAPATQYDAPANLRPLIENSFIQVIAAFPRASYAKHKMLAEENTDVRIEDAIPEAYQPFAQPILAAFAQPALVTTETDVAETVWRAANDMSGQLRFPAGPDAAALARSR